MADDWNSDDLLKLMECFNATSVDDISNFMNLDFTNCSFWESREPGERLIAPPGEIGMFRSFPCHQKDNDFFSAWKVLLFIPIVILSICGNYLILHVLYKFKQTRNCANIFIGNMAIADLLSTLFLTWPGVTVDIYSNYPLGSFYCQFESVFKFSCLLASQLSLLTLSADRLKKVMLPFRRSLQIRHAVAICAGIWIAAIATAGPLVSFRSLGRRQWKDFEEVWCYETKKESQVYWLTLLVILIYCPLLLMLVFYTGILCQMKKYEERLNESGNPVRSLHRKRIIQMIWVYLVVAIVCWTPLQVLVFYRRQPILRMPDWYKQVVFAQHFFASLNPAVNPIIYGVVNETFRKAITLQFPCFAKILKPQPLTTMSRSRPSDHQIRMGPKKLRNMFAVSSVNCNVQKTSSSGPGSPSQPPQNRISVVLNERL